MTGDLTVSSERYPMAALIRFTLIALYLAMVAPLPLLAPAAAQQPGTPAGMANPNAIGV